MAGQKSAPKGFSKGLVTDVDPRYQLDGSYRDAMNIKLVNSEGSTFTVENIKGNKKVLDLDTITKHLRPPFSPASTISDQYFQPRPNSYPYGPDGNPARGSANIVGHFSFKNQLFLIVTGYIRFGSSSGSNASADWRTVFFLIDFDSEGNVVKCTDLRVCYSVDDEWPNLDMDPLIKCRVEGIVENDAISRVYWTDNKNPLRTISLNDPDLHNLDPSELDVNPKAIHNQIVLESTISGSLPVGVYQYAYKYITDSGAESGISPLSNLYHISNANSSGYKTYYGGAPGNLSNDGFLLSVQNLDSRFDKIIVYSIFYEGLNFQPEVSEVGTFDINNNEAKFRHTSLTTVIQNGIESILIPTNTWDVCKDIAIKDNVLFAANLRQKKNYVTEKEWNVKILRYKQSEIGNGIGGSLTTTDSNVKDYYCSGSYDPNNVVEAGSATSYVKSNLSTTNPFGAHRYLPNQGSAEWGASGNSESRNILGGQSFGYYSTSDGASQTNALGGVKMSFRQVGKKSDTEKNHGNDYSGSSFIQVNEPNDSIQTDNLVGSAGQAYNVDTTYTASFNIGSNKDPHASGNKRGYQRGETYRFGVLVYDKNGDPGNVLWMGDIQMPGHMDKAWELDLDATQLGRDAGNSLTKWRENPLAQDYRMSAHTGEYVPGHDVAYDHSSCVRGSDTASGCGQKTPFLPNATSGQHWTMDLAVDFTFKIPKHVRDKISGFRVVRAERTETDRTIIQSGLLNQVINFDGYVTASQDGGIEATLVEAGDTESIIAQSTDEVYDTVLSGYFGVNAISQAVVAQNIDDDPIFAREDDIPNNSDIMHGSMSRHFGSLNISRKHNVSQNEAPCTVAASANTAIMYSPDSTFGVRPYAHRAEDYIVNICTLKLYNNFNIDSSNGGLGLNEDSYTDIVGGNNSNPLIIGTSDVNQWSRNYTRKVTKDDESGALVGKCFVYDTQFRHYYHRSHNSNTLQLASGFRECYVDTTNTIYSGAFNDDEKVMPFTTGNAIATTTSPFQKIDITNGGVTINNFSNLEGYKYNRLIYSAKEIGDGELVDKSFFYQTGLSHPTSYIAGQGFSNFSLGACYIRAPFSYQNWFMYGKLNSTIDLSYETVSSLQMGTRGIIISTDQGFANVYDPALHIRTQQWKWMKGSKAFISSGDDDILHGIGLMPYYNYGNIMRNNDGQYGGDSLDAIKSTRWIPAGNFHPINVANQHHHSTVFGGDTFVGIYSHQITSAPYPEKSFAKWITFPCESYVNVEMRSGLHLGAGDTEEGFDQTSPPFSNDWFYNDVYSQENTIKSALAIQDDDQEFTDLPYEIAYSKTKLAGEQSDAFRVFPIFNFYDVEAIYGPINRLINFQNEIHFFQDNAFGQLLVNPRTFLQDTSGVQSIFTGSGDTIESHQYISIKYGTRHMHSVIASERNLYFFDIRFAKLLKYGSDKKLISISDDLGVRDLFEEAVRYGRLKVQDKYPRATRVNYSDMPLYFMGIHGAFDYSTNTLYMTFADRLRIDEYDSENNQEGEYIETTFDDTGARTTRGYDPYQNSRSSVGHAPKGITSSTISYNEDIDAIISKYSIYPQQWIEHNGRIYNPKARVPLFRLSGNGSVTNGFYNTGSNIYGQALGGKFGSGNDVNEMQYTPGTHEYQIGSVELWEWEKENDLGQRTVFFGDERLQTLYQTGAYDPFVTADFVNDYALALGVYTKVLDPADGINTDAIKDNLLVKHIVHRSYIEKIINDVPSENKKFDNLNVVTNVKATLNNPLEPTVKMQESNNILSYLIDPNNDVVNVLPGDESLDIGMYFESIDFDTDVNPGGIIDISTTNRPGYPTQTEFSDTLHKYREGILRVPLRNRVLTQRTVGTYLRVRVAARTTEKFNIFAIMAKYRKSYN